MPRRIEEKLPPEGGSTLSRSLTVVTSLRLIIAEGSERTLGSRSAGLRERPRRSSPPGKSAPRLALSTARINRLHHREALAIPRRGVKTVRARWEDFEAPPV